jgi:predicted  nucleic acid-binding Zn-ribbon protein
MIRSTTILSAALLLALSAGCDKTGAADQEKANQAQNEANDKIATAKAEADQKITAAQSEADKKVAAAQGDFAKTVEDYRHSTQANLDDLNKKIDTLDAKAQTLKGKPKADLQTSLGEIRVKRDALVLDRKALESTTATAWDGTKARLDKEWTELKALVDKIS